MTRQRDERALIERSMDDREATELHENLFRDPNNLQALTPPARAGEHLRWVARSKNDDGRFRSRVAQGYRAVRYSEYPDFAPFRNLIASAAVAPDDPITHKDDLILMACSTGLAERRVGHYQELAHRQNIGAHQVTDMPRVPGMPLTDDSSSTTDIQRVRRPAQFG